MRDDVYLVDMVHAAEEARRFVVGRSEADFNNDRILQLALVKEIEIIGEAASRLTSEFRESHSDIPWKDMIGMRHRLVHDYTRINLGRVWATVRDDLQPLIDQLRPLIPDEPDDESE